MSNEVPEGLKFTDEHEWAREDDEDVVTVGITHHAQDLLGDIVYVELPRIGEEVEAAGEFGVVESVKAASDLYSPVSGEVVEVNDELEGAPELVNESPYEDGWMLRVRMSDPSELDDLMDTDDYADLLAAQ